MANILPTGILKAIPDSIIPSAAARTRSMMVAVVLGTAFAATNSNAAPAAIKVAPLTTPLDTTPEIIRELTRYCQTCWRNARLPADRWDDCTQQVLMRLLERVPVGRWNQLLQVENDDRREFFRAIDAVKKRTQRLKRHAEIGPDHADYRRHSDEERTERLELLNRAADEVLTDRQRKIVELSASGWEVAQIASELDIPPERISDEKYKAIRKLRNRLAVGDSALS